MALTHEADDKIRSRWRRADNLAHEKGDGLKNITIKEGEVAAVLGRTWAVLASMQGQHAEEDEQLELARDLLRLNLTKTKTVTPIGAGSGLSEDAANTLATSPFRNLLFSVPSLLSSQIPPPLDMVLSPSDLQLYSCINAYLLSMRRAHIRLTDLWKITSLRRHHPAPRGAANKSSYSENAGPRGPCRCAAHGPLPVPPSSSSRETEAYLQTEIVAGLWEGFHTWLTPPQGGRDTRSGATTPAPRPSKEDGEGDDDDEDEGGEEEEDLWLHEGDKYASVQDIPKKPNPSPSHDPQTLSTAHRLYLRTLIHRLLLTEPNFTQPLYSLLIHIDHLVAHLHRLHAIYTSLDLEEDAGVVDAFVDLEAEERDVKRLLVAVENRVRAGIEDVVAALRSLEADPAFAAEWEGDSALALAEHVPGTDDDAAAERGGYVPARVGGINRLLMKLDFGTWFGRSDDEGDSEM